MCCIPEMADTQAPADTKSAPRHYVKDLEVLQQQAPEHHMPR